jgi:ATP-dependent DNA helicase DinG
MIKANTSLSINEILSSDGIISRSYPGFEVRPQQVQMGCAVEKAFLNGQKLVVEAGTGIGKSFAYLIPAIQAVGGGGAGKILISTFTITLQEQLINKDIPFLASCLPFSFSAVLAKGRGNYLCKRRLEFSLKMQSKLFSQLNDELAEINKWASQTKDGSLGDPDLSGFIPSGQAWDAVNSEHGNCPGRKCKYFQNCFYRRARRQLESADIIVANHALMFSDLALKEQSVEFLPEYKYVIIDEAHNIEHVAEEHFGIDISNRRVKYLLDGLYNNRTHRGLLAYNDKTEKAIETAARIRKESSTFFNNIKNWYEANVEENGGRCYKNFVVDNFSGYLKQLRSELGTLANNTDEVDEKFEIIRYVNLTSVLIKDMEDFLGQEKNDYVYWVEVNLKKTIPLVRLKSAALNVSDDVKRVLFDKYQSVIMTSATLSSGADEKSGFNFFAGRIGLSNFDAVKLGSPFDYENQVTIYIEKDLPDPNNKEFVIQAVEKIKKYLLQTKGRAFVLFTSYSMLERMAEKIHQWLIENNIELLQQGSDIDRGTLLKRFKRVGKAVLFGTDSFWQGVDVPGEALSNVVIVRLPFAVPDKPLLAGRLEQIRNKGGNPFFDYQLPSAIIKFKQGFGRLIRSRTDKGIVVILDSRITRNRYGQMFLSAIPKCTVKIVGSDK